jgi:hypothetical protein
VNRVSRRTFAASFAGGLYLSAQTPPAPEAPQGLPPRASAGDYQSQAKVGNYTIGADFTGHAVPTRMAPLSSEDYVAVELAFYGPADAKLKLSFEEFQIRINGKKTTIPSQQFGMVMKSLSDPEWIPETPAEGPKSKGGLSTGGGQAGDPKPLPPKMPFPLRRAMELKAKGAALPEGERALPVAGLVFFPYRGKDSGIQNVELIYKGAAGEATITLVR